MNIAATNQSGDRFGLNPNMDESIDISNGILIKPRSVATQSVGCDWYTTTIYWIRIHTIASGIKLLNLLSV